jgi:hypothetical protein
MTTADADTPVFTGKSDSRWTVGCHTPHARGNMPSATERPGRVALLPTAHHRGTGAGSLSPRTAAPPMAKAGSAGDPPLAAARLQHPRGAVLGRAVTIVQGPPFG